MADHARANGFSRVADLSEELTVRRLGKSPQDLVAAAGRVFCDMLKLDPELLLGIVLLELLFKPRREHEGKENYV